MPGTHYFDRCDSLESAAAGCVLQVIARVHDQSTASASGLLTHLVGEPVEIGMEIAQRAAGDDAVPDGLVVQRSFKILVVAKVDSAVSLDQMLRHARSFGNEDQKILLLVTREPVGHQAKVIAGLIRGTHPAVLFRNITFGAVGDALTRQSGGADGPMADLIDSYREFCDQLGLFESSRVFLRVVPCGRGLDTVKKSGIYYQPTESSYNPRSLLGLYADRKVQAVLGVRSVFDVQLAGGDLTKKLIDGENTDRFDAGLREVIESVRVSSGSNISTGTRFFCGDVHDTDFRKSSPGDVFRVRLVELGRIVGGAGDAGEVASRLRGKEWA